MVTRSVVKVGGQGQGIGHGVKSGEGSRLGIQVGGQGLGRGQGLGVKVVVKVRGQGCGVKVVGSRSGLVVTRSGSMLGVKVRGVVKVMGRGSMPGSFGSDGRWGEVTGWR